MSNSHSTITASAMLDLKAIAGVDKYFSNTPSLELEGTSYTPVVLKGILQGEVDAEKALDDARAKVRELMGSTRNARAQARALRKALRTYLLASKGPGAAQLLAEFGFVLKAKSTPTVATKAQAKVKTQATRAARHTMGSRQKQAIKGQAPETPATPKPA